MEKRLQAALAAALLTAASDRLRPGPDRGAGPHSDRALVAPVQPARFAGDAVRAVHEQPHRARLPVLRGSLPGDLLGARPVHESGGQLRQVHPGHGNSRSGSPGGREPRDRARGGLRHTRRRSIRRASYRQELPHHGDRHPDDQQRNKSHRPITWRTGSAHWVSCVPSNSRILQRVSTARPGHLRFGAVHGCSERSRCAG